LKRELQNSDEEEESDYSYSDDEESDDDDKGVVTGKWLIFEPMDEIDETWKMVSAAVLKGILGFYAKVTTMKDKGTAFLELI